MKDRLLYFDILRILSCVMILLMHVPMPGLGTPGFVLSGISYLTEPGIGVFFMLSGALALKTSSLFIESSPFLFLRKKLIRIGVPLLFWTFLDRYGVNTSEVGILWFLWTLIGLYLLTPILSRWLSFASLKEVEFYLLLWFISLMYCWLEQFQLLNMSDTSWLYYFHGYVGYYVLGWYLINTNRKWKGSIKWVFYFLLLIFGLIAPIVVLFGYLQVDYYHVFWYISPSVMIMSTAFFLLIKRLEYGFQSIKGKKREIIVWLSNITFGIYLVQMILMRGILWRTEWMQNMNGLVQIVVCMILTFVLSAILTAIIKKIPYLNLVVGG